MKTYRPCAGKKSRTTSKTKATAKPKAKATKPKAKGPSAAQKRQQSKIAKVNALAITKIYEAGKRGKPKPTWKQANKAAAREVFK